MQTQDLDLKIVARDKDCLHMLLDHAGWSYTSRGSGRHSLLGKYLYSFRVLALILVELIRFRPCLCISLSSPYLSILSRLLGIRSVCYDDTDQNPRLLPLIRQSTYLLSPATYPHKFHGFHFHLPAFKELAYLHPDYFPHATVRDGVFFRLTRTDSVHHSAGSALDQKLVLEKIQKLSQEQRIILSSEMGLHTGEDAAIRPADPVRIHEELNSCKVFWGNSATMAAEAAVLGIPAIFVSAEKFSYISELETYGLVYYYPPDQLPASLERVDSILSGKPSPGHFRELHQAMLVDKIDLTAFLIWFIKELPDSAIMLERDPACVEQIKAGH
jgi:predicted glycosyltransferase